MKVSKFCTFEINLLGQIFSIVICVWFPCPYEDLNIKKKNNKQTNICKGVFWNDFIERLICRRGRTL